MLDNDVFQYATIGLLVLTFLVSLLNLSALNAIRRGLGRHAGAGAEAGIDRERPFAQEDSGRAETTTGYGTATYGERQPAGGSSGYVGGTAYGGSGAATADAAPAAAAAAGGGATDYGAARGGRSPAEEPQEQPFERDGRWYYRRGDELLVYDEATGEWVDAAARTAPASAASPVPATAASGSAASDYLSGIGGAAGGAQPAGETAGGWKCPTCGAMNGSTASSCRMCFTARP